MGILQRLDLTGARVIVTGASSGIGRALAKELATEKARLALAARSESRLEELASELKTLNTDVQIVPTDIADAQHRQRLVEGTIRAFGGIDILINNAGVGSSGLFTQTSETLLRQVFEVNFFGAVELTRLALPHLQQGRHPMIVNVSSVIGRRAIPGYTEYCSSKFALSGWTEALRAELVREGIHVLLVSPGLIATPFRDNLLEDRLSTRRDRASGMSPERCARIIVQAMRRRRNEVVITWGGKFLVLLNRWFPRLVDAIMVRYLHRTTDEHR
jgi:short-subunit dehydrogenase